MNNSRVALALAIPGAALLIFGLLWLACWLVSGFQFPVAGYEGWNAVAGAALIVTGGALLVRALFVRRR